MLKLDIVANYLGQAWSALMGLAFVPMYIKYLGIEAYGLIGIFAVLNAWFSLLDLGMTPTLGREMARFTGGSQSVESIRDLLRSIELITFFITLVIVVAFGFSADWVATSWLRSITLPRHDISQSVAIMGLVGALRFVETIYRSSILGLQRQVLFNFVNSILATLRGLGALVILGWISSSIQVFFLWQGFLSIITVIIFAAITYSSLPPIRRRARFSIEALREVCRFMVGMLGITFLALLLIHVDKVMLIKLLNLREYGYYALACAVAGVVYMLVTPITQAVYPRMCELRASVNDRLINQAFHLSAQLVTICAGSFSILLIFLC